MFAHVFLQKPLFAHVNIYFVDIVQRLTFENCPRRQWQMNLQILSEDDESTASEIQAALIKRLTSIGVIF